MNILKGYMEDGVFSRGVQPIRGFGSIVMVGNFDVDVAHQQRIGHLFGPLPPEMRNDTAFMDRVHAYLPGWDVPKLDKRHFTNHFGLVSDVLSECWRALRLQSRLPQVQGRLHYGGALSGRDTNAVNKTVSALLKLLHPGAGLPIPDEDVEWAVRIALEARRRVKEQQKRIGAVEFRNTHFSYVLGDDGTRVGGVMGPSVPRGLPLRVNKAAALSPPLPPASASGAVFDLEKFVATPELQSSNGVGADPLEPGQVWTIAPGGAEDGPGLYRIEANVGPGSGVKLLNTPAPVAFRESLRAAEQNLYARAAQFVGDKDPRQHEFNVQLRAFDAAKTGGKVGVAALLALSTALLNRSVRGGLVIVGEVSLGGAIEPVHNPVVLAEMAVERGAAALLMPVACRRQLVDLSDEMATKIDVQFYSDARDALMKAMG